MDTAVLVETGHESPAPSTPPANQDASEAIPESPPNSKGQFTRSNAVEMGKRSALAQQQRKQAAEQRRAELKAIAETPVVALNFQQERLSRVRAQLTKLDVMMAEETDPQRLDRLASAQARLSEQERILDGRPLPGSHRPTKPRKAGGSWLAPVPEE